MTFRKNYQDEVEALQNYQIEAEKKFAKMEHKHNKLAKKIKKLERIIDESWSEEST